MKIQGNDHFIPWCLNTISHTILRVPIYRYGHSITARLNLLLSNGWHPIVYCQGTRILFWLRGMIIKGSNHRWQAQIRWKKCWTTIHAFQELKQGNTEILGTARPRDMYPRFWIGSQNTWGTWIFTKSLADTLYNTILRIARNLLETKENIKIESDSFYHIIFDRFSWGSSKFFFFFEKKNPKWPIFKMAVFQNRQFLKFFCKNFTDWCLGW